MSGDLEQSGCPSETDLPLVPLFPLPNIVLFPKAVLPLHIFEDRYKAMTSHALEGDGLIAMGLLRPGWQKSYYAKPEVDPIVCVGSILSHEQLPDGKYNFLLQGLMRCRVICEVSHDPYRLVKLQRLAEVAAPEAVLRVQRKRLVSLFTSHALAGTAIGVQFAKLLATTLSTPAIADLAAYNFLDDVPLKQSLLSEADVAARVIRTVGAVEKAAAALSVELSCTPDAVVAAPDGHRLKNPSMN